MELSFKLVGDEDMKIVIPKSKTEIESQIDLIKEIIKRTKDKSTKRVYCSALEDLEIALAKARQ